MTKTADCPEGNTKVRTEDGFLLDADHYSGTTNRGVIFLHGACERRGHEAYLVSAASRLAEQGIHTLAFDFRGHGNSEGDSRTDFRISLLLRDVAAAAEFLREKGVKHFGLAGASVGGAVATLYAGAHPLEIHALGLVNPVLDFHTAPFEPLPVRTRAFFAQVHEALESEVSFTVPWNGFQLGRAVFDELRSDPEMYDPGHALRTYAGALCVLHGDHDEEIEYSETVRVLAETNRSDALITIAGGTHAFSVPAHHDMVVARLVRFFGKFV